ncbi:early transcribed membrane protein [Plasmodium brasilianum]|uniref:Early transcribed membrane protein n=2 Tax=Plasmodium (Plasmodium) TaxID=418103 RepID=A0A1A8WRN4_PLAMA|nr:uncharacterized protein PMUG01_10012700 [Plasmodium malariae]KAI4837673.1 early transcribed membrane protein [Plasmodium brasilianum]SBS94976.1 early transcribed membrane protein [Plasmodium malariae]SCN44562.1 hypothetical protein PMUG01_10012700 [Plasmodium malariae]
MKFSKVYTVIAVIFAVKLINPTLCDQVSTNTGPVNNKANSGTTSTPATPSKSDSPNSPSVNSPSTNSASTNSVPSTTASLSSLSASPPTADESDKVIDKINEELEKKKKKKKVCILSAAATAMALLLGSALGFGIYKHKKGSKQKV